MRVKICGIQNEHDLQTAVEAGTDAVGFLVGQLHKSSSFILPSTAARLAHLLPPYVTPVIVTHLTTAEEIKEILDKSGIYCVQLHGIENEQVFKLRDMLPVHSKIILAEYVENLSNDNNLEELYPVIDAIALDCYNKEPSLIGVSSEGKSYEWRAGAEFVSQCPLPVILTGGLNPDNVGAAIGAVRPFGVDACTSLKDDTIASCDQEKCRNFVKRAKTAFLSL
jgi:phosphoribosylanthranilate isomerase